MASISSKGGGDSKKTIHAKLVLSPNNNNVEKTPAKSIILKSPSTKIISKAISPTQRINDLTKSNSLPHKKMDSGSPPKVARSPSAKSITPPNKIQKAVQMKPCLNRSNSQGDGIPIQIAKTEILVENDVQSTENFDDLSSKIEASTSVSEMEEMKFEPIIENNYSSNNNGSIANISKSVDGSTKVITEQQLILTTEQNLASGDKIVIQEKSEAEQISDENLHFETKDVILKNDDNNVNDITLEMKKINLKDYLKDGTHNLVDIKAELFNENCTENEADVVNNDIRNEKATEIIENVQITSSPLKDSVDTSTSTDCTECSVETAKLVSEPEITKQSLRSDMWTHMDKNDLVSFPKPCKGRIPNFKGAPAAAEKLIALDVFKNSKTIKINPDKPQEMVRYHTLEYGKRLLVPIPRLREGVFQAVVPPAEASKYQLQQASQRYGMKKWSKPVSTDDKISIDLIVLGSVVVDRKGHRIGKGEGFADLEFAMLADMNAINENTVIVTTVHDDQVRDELPDHLFKEHDVPIDLIITPTQVFEVSNKLQRPKGIIWKILSNRRILEIPVLQMLRQQELSLGHECELKEVDSDVEEKPFVPRFARRRRFNNYSRSTGDPLRDSKLQQPPQYYSRPQRFFQPQQNRMSNFGNIRRNNIAPPLSAKRVHYEQEYDIKQSFMRNQVREPRSRSNNRVALSESTINRARSMSRAVNMNRTRRIIRSRSVNNSHNLPRYPVNRRQSDNRPILNNNNTMTKSVEVQTLDKKTRLNRPFVKRKRPPFEFSLRVKNIGMGVRVRDLKIALNERGVKPRDITWRGYKGLAFLHFVKSTFKENTKSFTMEDIVQTLQGLPLPPKEKKTLVIELVKPKIMEENQLNGMPKTTNTTLTIST